MFGNPKHKTDPNNPMTWDNQPKKVYPQPCSVCHGTGLVPSVVTDENGNTQVVKDWCAACAGSGEA